MVIIPVIITGEINYHLQQFCTPVFFCIKQLNLCLKSTLLPPTLTPTPKKISKPNQTSKHKNKMFTVSGN